MGEKERGSSVQDEDLEAGGAGALDSSFRVSRSFTSALTQSISARTLLAIPPRGPQNEDGLDPGTSPVELGSSSGSGAYGGDAEESMRETADSAPITFAAGPTVPLIGSPFGYFVRGDRQSPGNLRDGGAMMRRLSTDFQSRRVSPTGYHAEGQLPTPRQSWSCASPSPRSSFTRARSPSGSPERDGLAEPLLGPAEEVGDVSWGSPLDLQPVGGSFPSDGQPRQNAVLMATIIGMVNSVIAIPAMISFTAIIYQDEIYEAFLPQLAKLAFLASAVHQTVFLLSSTLPFAVGQVQDVGLIFLSAMASSVAAHCLNEGLSKDVVLGTTLATQAISTLLVGVFIIIVGKLRLASLVQFVPLPVVGGYLGYVGFFCFVAGVSLATGVQVRQAGHVLELLGVGPALKLAAGIGGTVLMVGSNHLVRHPLALPAMLLAIPAGFYAVLAISGVSLQQARDAGWVAQAQVGSQTWRFWEIYELYNIHGWSLDGIHVSAMLRQLPTLFPLFFVVAFGSSMDVAGISQEMNGKQLDYDTELLTVGYSNLAAGLVGAPMTGSYIFSQTTFSLRSGVTSRANGVVVALMEFFLFAAPFSALPYLPSFYFGSLMMLIGWEIIRDWLIRSSQKVTRKEFLLLWATFLAICVAGLEIGICAGIVMATMSFAYSYARVHVTAFTLVPSRSSTMRPFEQRAVLELFSQRMAAVSLSGYVFFGSAINIFKRVMEVAQALLDAHPVDGMLSGTAGSLVSSKAGPGNSWFEGPAELRAAAALAAAPRIVLLDFRNVNGLDATAARTFGSLAAALHTRGARLLVTHVRKRTMQRLLAAHGVAVECPPSGAAHLPENGPSLLFPTMDAALEYCEEEFLRIACAYRLCKPPASSMSLADILHSHLEAPKVLMAVPVDYARTAATLMSFMERMPMPAGRVVFRPGDPADDMFIIEQGTIRVQMDYLGTESAAVELPEEVTAPPAYRYFNMRPASIVGDMDFFLQRQRSFEARCETDCSVLRITRERFGHLSLQAPQALIVLQTIILRSASLNETHALEILERSSLPR